ncbi:Hydroxymethylglutaryl-CoA synthase 1 [Trichinella nelsoni]|uniref:Hydroxymethylglutaryl-CoA synthase n=1 Tax=Trichinella nelsoni TaxID=6336 RepID=A0A0V0SLF2_9BILA|nr:Hydroxymethylglutaryl-CoA synthase 1 [Trichinella nelsoni]
MRSGSALQFSTVQSRGIVEIIDEKIMLYVNSKISFYKGSVHLLKNNLDYIKTMKLMDGRVMMENDSVTPNLISASNVGILAMQVYFPSMYVKQSELESADGVSKGKYEIGLGQHEMAVCSDREDACSMALTVVHRLLKRFNVEPMEIGRLEVGTESQVDRSKSVKSTLMQLFTDSGNTDLEGVDVVNACFGGTQALFNCVSWVESTSWDGRYALAVATDVAVYDAGPARCTGGAGAVAMLVGVDAPIVFDGRLKAFYMQDAYDFYKPTAAGATEYPVVDGALSVRSYFEALSRCYGLYCAKFERLCGKEARVMDFDAVLFHSPYCKLAKKALIRLVFVDLCRCVVGPSQLNPNMPNKGVPVRFDEDRLLTLDLDRNEEAWLMELSGSLFETRTKPSLLAACRVGNMYCASLWTSLACHLAGSSADKLVGQRLLMFSYGSGLASCMFSVQLRRGRENEEKLENIASMLADAMSQLEMRNKLSPEEFLSTMETREKAASSAPYIPTAQLEHLSNETFYLVNVDEKCRRKYALKVSEENEALSS